MCMEIGVTLVPTAHYSILKNSGVPTSHAYSMRQ